MPALPAAAAVAAAAARLFLLASMLHGSGACAQRVEAKYDLMVLKQDWVPSSCLEYDTDCKENAFGAFSIYGLAPSNIDIKDPYELGPCPGPPSNVSELPQAMKEELSCIAYNSVGNDEVLWQGLWDTQGRCSGLSPKKYFGVTIKAFQVFNANRHVHKAGISLEAKPSVDRDKLLDSLEARWGVKPWLARDPQSSTLLYVSTCFLPVAPSGAWNLQTVDCPWNRTSSDPGGSECAGRLFLKPGVAPTPQCEKHYPVTIRGAFPQPVPSLQPFSPPVQSESASPPVVSEPLLAPSTSPSAVAVVSAGSAKPVAPDSQPAGGLAPSATTPAPAPGPLPTLPSSKSDSVAVVAGVTVGATLAVGALVTAFAVWRKRRRTVHRRFSAGQDSFVSKEDSLVIPITTDLSGSGPDSFIKAPSTDPAVVSLLKPGARPSQDAAGSPTAWHDKAAQPAQPGTPHTTPSLLSPASLTPGAGIVDSDLLLSQIAMILTSVRTGQGDAAGDAGKQGPQYAPVAKHRQGQEQEQGRQHRPSSVTCPPGSPFAADMAHWAVRWEEIKVQRPIGQGSFGVVYMGLWHSTPVAVKVLLKAESMESVDSLGLPHEVMQQLQEEAAVMARIRHPNLVSFLGLCALPPSILTEYCSRGSLYDVLYDARRDPACAAHLTWQRRLEMAFDAARGLLYLHRRGIIHKDLKGPNLLVDEHWNVKVCDFNLSEILNAQEPDTATASASMATNPIWLAPEVLAGQPSTREADVYAFGLVMWEMLMWRLPWGARSPYQVRSFVLEGGRPEVAGAEALPGPGPPPPAALAAYHALMRACWSQEAFQRPSFDAVVDQLGALLGSQERQ